MEDPATLDLIRDVVVDLDLGLVRIHEVHHTLEEVFAIEGGDDGAASNDRAGGPR
ncbi:hypothetical protein [Allobranchiibius sp. GilTou38]|uniref:hypothetical protein n=1 Tax=Allobranchiibius sp. GilTou38 TaxID=2815210 RepID=UPI001FB5ADB2|nr:hypothetical protein [Allobranchiibius sp. GilTou38]